MLVRLNNNVWYAVPREILKLPATRREAAALLQLEIRLLIDASREVLPELVCRRHKLW
jgi:hypothetical protein